MSDKNDSFYQEHYLNTDTTGTGEQGTGQELPKDDAPWMSMDEPNDEPTQEPIRYRRKADPLRVFLIVAGIVVMVFLCASCLIGLYVVEKIYEGVQSTVQTISQIGHTSTYPALPTPTPTPRPPHSGTVTPAAIPNLEKDGSLKLNDVNFPDDNFRSYVAREFDLNGNGLLEESERKQVKTIKVPGSGILSLKGIEYFSELAILNCSENGLAELCVDQNKKLNALNCSGNMIYRIDLGSNMAMDYLVVDENVTVVNASFNVKVTTKEIAPQSLYASLKLVRLTEVNFPDPVFREYLRHRFDSDGNYVLDEEELKEVTEILIRSEYAKSLEGVGYFKSLEYLDCSVCPLKSVDLSYNSKLAYLLADPEVEVVGAREEIEIVHPGEISSDDVMIDETNFPDVRFREKVSALRDRNLNGALDRWERNTVIQLDVSGSEIKSLVGIEHFPYLNDLNCSDNSLTLLDLSGNPELSYLDCFDNSLTLLDLSGNPELSYLDCSSNSLTSLDVSGNPELSDLDCDCNHLTSLDLSGNPELSDLDCDYNHLTSLDLSGNPKLRNLDCAYNGITSLDVSNNPELIGLAVDSGVEVIGGTERLSVYWGTHKPDQNYENP